MRLRAKIGLVLSLLAFAAMMALVAFLVPAQGAVSQPADPPECTLIVIQNLGGAGGRIHVNFCGAGSEGLSPLRPESPEWGPFLVDGARLTPADCTRAAPCSVFAENAPQTGS